MRHRIRQLWSRRSKKFDGFERVSMHSSIPEYGEDRTEIHCALLDPAGEYCMRRKHFEIPGRLPTWNNRRIRDLYDKLPFNLRWGRGIEVVKVWVGETPSCIKPFKF